MEHAVFSESNSFHKTLRIFLILTFFVRSNCFQKKDQQQPRHHYLLKPTRAKTLSTFLNVNTLVMSTETGSSYDNPRALVLSLIHHLGSRGSDSDIHLILASQSPRRREILDMMGLQGKFTPTPSPMDEEAFQQTISRNDPVKYTRKSAEEKARALALDIMSTVNKPTLILGSDTIVDLDGIILEKPVDKADAKRMLRSMSGRKHSVHTGVALYYLVPTTTSLEEHSDSAPPTLMASFTDTAQVCFSTISEKDMDAYIATKEPMDKAGSYGIQGIGGQFVRNIEGDFFTVMGLPMHRTSTILAEAISKMTGNTI